MGKSVSKSILLPTFLVLLSVFAAFHPIAGELAGDVMRGLIGAIATLVAFCGYLATLLLSRAIPLSRGWTIALNVAYLVGLTAWLGHGLTSDLPYMSQRAFLWLATVSALSLPLIGILLAKK